MMKIVLPSLNKLFPGHDEVGKPPPCPDLRLQARFLNLIRNLLWPKEMASHQGHFFQKCKPFDRESADIELLNDQKPIVRQDSRQLPDHLTLIREMVQGIDRDDPFETSVGERQMRRIGPDKVAAPFFSSLSEHTGGDVGHHILLNQGAQGHRDPACSATGIEQAALYRKLKQLPPLFMTRRAQK
jgi:hypothetical protein